MRLQVVRLLPKRSLFKAAEPLKLVLTPDGAAGVTIATQTQLIQISSTN